MNAHGAKVLVVDDDPRNLKLISVRLRADGYEVLTADSGAKAIEIVRATRPDVILLDIMMPEMDGYEVTRRLKKDFDTQSIPIVLITALHAVKDRVKGLNAGADDFLTKPIDTNELLARVRSLARTSALENELRLRTRIEKQFVSPAVTTDKKSILLIEDDHKMVGLIKDMLSGAGYAPVGANSGREGLDLLETTIPALIILDLLLPDMDGFELLKQLKHREGTKDIPILIVSCLNESSNKIKGLDLGADDYLIKPVNKKELIAVLKQCFAEALNRSCSNQNYRKCLPVPSQML